MPREHGSEEETMTRLMEHSRRRGPFDPRQLVARQLAFRARLASEDAARAAVEADGRAAAVETAVASWESEGGAASRRADRRR
jgi:hypothetical protein